MPQVLSPEVRLFFCGGENFCVHNIVFTQLGSVTEGFKLCWRTGQKAHTETILLTLLHDLNVTCTLLHLCFELVTCLFLEPSLLV